MVLAACPILTPTENVQTNVVMSWLIELAEEHASRKDYTNAAVAIKKAMYHMGTDKGEVTTQVGVRLCNKNGCGWQGKCGKRHARMGLFSAGLPFLPSPITSNTSQDFLQTWCKTNTAKGSLRPNWNADV